VKGIVIVILACLCLAISVVGQTWSEMGFGTVITNTSMLEDPLKGLSKMYDSLSSKGKDLQDVFIARMDKTAQANGLTAPPADDQTPTVAGRYAYILFVAIAMVASAVAIILIGREDAEEKTVLPVKK